MSHHVVLLIVVVIFVIVVVISRVHGGNDEVCGPDQLQLDSLNIRDQWEPFRGPVAVGVRSNAHFTDVGCIEQDESRLSVDVRRRERLICTEIIGVIRRRRHVPNPEENDFVYRLWNVHRVEQEKNE